MTPIMRRLLGGAALLGLAAAAAACAAQPTAVAPIEAAAPAKPEIGEWGLDLTQFDASVEPGDDFFRHVNGKWLDTFEIPADFSRYGSFTVLFERSEEQVKAIIQELAAKDNAPGSVEQKIGDYYAAYTDLEAIETKGLAPAEADLAAIASADTHEDIAMLMADPGSGAQAWFGGYVNVDQNQPDRYTFYLWAGGLGLPDRDYYLDEKYTEQKAAYRGFVEEMLTLAGDADAAAKADAILALEEKMAEVHWPRAFYRDDTLTNNPITLAELEAHAPEMPWAALMEKAGLGGHGDFILATMVRDDLPAETLAKAKEAGLKPVYTELAKLFRATPVETWQAYLKFHYLSDHAAYLPQAFDEARFDFYGRTLSGQPEQRERWKRGVAEINGSLGEAVGQVYVERHFPPESKAKMLDLVANVKAAFLKRLDENEWMSEATKAEARDKMAKFTVKIGYPEKWKDYSAMDIRPGEALHNAKAANLWEWNDQLAKLGGPIDRTEWFMSPQTVNAYYNPTMNEIVFPAAILQPPFFDPNADPAVNYGGIGGVIGHEIGHGFDDQGRKSDGDGKQRDWWQPEDAAAFMAQTARLGAQYSSFEPIPGHFLNGDLTMGENIGDLGGLELSLEAYKMSLGGEEAPVLDGYTGVQRVFLSWAQIWRSKDREEEAIRRIATGPHSLPYYRVNGVVPNMDDWYEVFDVAEDDAMFISPEERVSIW